MILSLGAITYLLYRTELLALKGSLFLELKNYSYTFEGERFSLDVVEVGKGDRFYELYEGKEGLYILVPVPGTKKDALKVIYPRTSYERDLAELKRRSLIFFGGGSLVAFLLSLGFAYYSLNPLRRAVRLIEEVMRDILHDLNTPIMTLLVNLRILQKKYEDEEIERAVMALRQLESLKENLRPLKEKAELKFERLDLKRLVEDLAGSLKKAFPDRVLEMELSDVHVKADRTAVERIVANLLENALKHSKGKGPVRVILVDGSLTVENPSEALKDPSRLTERYYRESQRGLGLGLSIVKKLCDEMGWDLELSYREGIFTARVNFR